MADRMYRTQILLKPEQHKALTELARRESRSISDLVREMIQRCLDQQRQVEEEDIKRYTDGLERISAHREAILERRGGRPLEIDVVEMINRMREERDERNLSGDSPNCP